MSDQDYYYQSSARKIQEGSRPSQPFIPGSQYQQSPSDSGYASHYEAPSQNPVSNSPGGGYPSQPLYHQGYSSPYSTAVPTQNPIRMNPQPQPRQPSRSGYDYEPPPAAHAPQRPYPQGSQPYSQSSQPYSQSSQSSQPYFQTSQPHSQTPQPYSQSSQPYAQSARPSFQSSQSYSQGYSQPSFQNPPRSGHDYDPSYHPRTSPQNFEYPASQASFSSRSTVKDSQPMDFSQDSKLSSWEDYPQASQFSDIKSQSSRAFPPRPEWTSPQSPEIESESLQGALIDNSKQHVILFCSKNGINPIVNFGVDGPDHLRTYTAVVTVNIPRGPTISKTASHKSKKEAEKIAFDKVLQELSGLRLLSTVPAKGDSDEGAQVVARKKEVREFCEKYHNHIPEAKFRAVGPDHMPTFEASLTIPGGISGIGAGKTKKDAEKVAYAIVYEQIKALKLAGSFSSSSSVSSRSSDTDSAYGSASSRSSGGSSLSFGKEKPQVVGGINYAAPGPIPFTQGLTTAQMFARERPSPEQPYVTYVTSPIPITPEGTDRSKKFIIFYCDHFRCGPPSIDEIKSPPGVPNQHTVIVEIKDVVIAKSRGGSKAEARGHCFNYVYEYLRHRNPEVVEMFDSVMVKNPHGLENLVEIELTPSQRRNIKDIITQLANMNYGRTRDNAFFVPKVQPIFVPESPERLKAKSEFLYQDHISKLNRPSQLRNEVANLPIAQYRRKILDAIEQNQVVVVCAETGSGKTTQTPQFIFDDFIEKRRGAECNIIVTQPRRISAMTVALRVSEERGGQLGQTVGYNIRFEAVMPKPNGCIVFCTTGILLRMIQSNSELDHISHLILDEVHERDINNDFLMILIRDLIKKRPMLKIVLMSATINQQLFSDYFDGCPIVEIPGKIFHVETLYLNQIAHVLHENGIVVQDLMLPNRREADEELMDEEGNVSNDPESLKNIPYALIESILVYIARVCQEGSVLIFLPGWEQIRDLADLIRRDRYRVGFANPNYFEIHCLHSSISTLHQHEVFRPVPRGVRKIVLSTNIAETSITIPDVVYVIDTVRQKEMNFIVSRRMSSLDIAWVSRANARQRMGRAGRVRPGVYFCLLSKERFQTLPEHQVPEMYRLDLQEICLAVKALGFPSIREFLNRALQPPDWKNVDAAVDRLKQLQALDYAENLTPLGKLLALLPVDPGLGKMLFSSVILGCLDPILTIIAASTTKDPFINTPERKAQSREKRINFSKGTNSDHIAIVNAYNEWRRASSTPYVNHFCESNCLSQPNLQNIRKIKEQLFKILTETGFVPESAAVPIEPFGGEYLNRQTLSQSLNPVLKAVLCSGFYPNYAERAKKRMYRTKEDKTTFVHPSSVNYKGGSNETEGLSPFIVFQEKFRTARIFLTNTTQVSPFGILLFGGIPDSSSGGHRTLIMDDWLVFSCAEEDVRLISALRNEFDWFLRKSYVNPQLRFSELESRLVEAIIDISSSKY